MSKLKFAAWQWKERQNMTIVDHFWDTVNDMLEIAVKTGQTKEILIDVTFLVQKITPQAWTDINATLNEAGYHVRLKKEKGSSRDPDTLTLHIGV